MRLIEFKDKLGEMYTHRLVKLEPDLRAPCKPFDLSKVGEEFFEMMDKVNSAVTHASTQRFIL